MEHTRRHHWSHRRMRYSDLRPHPVRIQQRQTWAPPVSSWRRGRLAHAHTLTHHTHPAHPETRNHVISNTGLNAAASVATQWWILHVDTAHLLEIIHTRYFVFSVIRSKECDRNNTVIANDIGSFLSIWLLNTRYMRPFVVFGEWQYTMGVISFESWYQRSNNASPF